MKNDMQITDFANLNFELHAMQPFAFLLEFGFEK